VSVFFCVQHLLKNTVGRRTRRSYSIFGTLSNTSSEYSSNALGFFSYPLHIIWTSKLDFLLHSASVTKVRFGTGPNPVRTPNRTRSSVPGSAFGRTRTAGPVRGSTTHGSPEPFENTVQTGSNAVLIGIFYFNISLNFYLDINFSHSILSARHSTSSVSCDTVFVSTHHHHATTRSQRESEGSSWGWCIYPQL
jgi:hypothetical protein